MGLAEGLVLFVTGCMSVCQAFLDFSQKVCVFSILVNGFQDLSLWPAVFECVSF